MFSGSNLRNRIGKHAGKMSSTELSVIVVIELLRLRLSKQGKKNHILIQTKVKTA